MRLRKSSAAAVAVLALHATLAFRSATVWTPTFDESAHVAVGLSYWQTGSFRLYPHNPPLARLLESAPALLLGARNDYEHAWRSRLPRPELEFGREFVAANAEGYWMYVVAARTVAIGFSAALGWLVFAWTRRLFGPLAGVCAVVIYSFENNAIAHAALATTDAAAAAACFGATWAFCRYLEAPDARRAALAGVALGVALLCKFSCLLLLFLWPALLAASVVQRTVDRSIDRVLAHAALALALAVLIVNAGYRFEGTGCRLGDFPFASTLLAVETHDDAEPFRNRFVDSWLGTLRVPLPANFVIGFDRQSADNHANYPSFMFDRLYEPGPWYFYLAVLALKTSTPLLPLSLLALSLRTAFAGTARFLLLAGSVLAFFSFAVELKTSFRYLLPALPFACVGLGVAAARLIERTGVRGKLAVACLSVHAAVAVAVSPHHLSYFNALAASFTPTRGYLLGDSNVDWGQDLHEFRRWLDRHPEFADVRLAYWGSFDPRFAGVADLRTPPVDRRSVPFGLDLAEIGPQPGNYAVSVSLLQGQVCEVQQTGGARYAHPRDAFAYFNDFVPSAKPTPSIWLYSITQADVDSYMKR